MFRIFSVIVGLYVMIYAQTENPPITCPTGGQIFELGISPSGQSDAIYWHNYYRLQIALGNVTGQPKGTNLYKQIYDTQLGIEARPVSLSCKFQHITSTDLLCDCEELSARWSWVGQNMFIVWSTAPSNGQNWPLAIKSWFNEQNNFVYPNKSSNGKEIYHYTQLVWATSQYIGCDFIYFNDTTQPNYPYAKMYTCNYGPGGNIIGVAPYSTTGNQCPNLC